MRGGLRTLTMASAINEIADQCVDRIALGPLWRCQADSAVPCDADTPVAGRSWLGAADLA
jgi:hypothetical protein